MRFYYYSTTIGRNQGFIVLPWEQFDSENQKLMKRKNELVLSFRIFISYNHPPVSLSTDSSPCTGEPSAAAGLCKAKAF